MLFFEKLPVSTAAFLTAACGVMMFTYVVLQNRVVSDRTNREGASDKMNGVQAMVRDHTGDSRWGAHAHAIAHGNMWKMPGNGGHDDKVCCVTCILQGFNHMHFGRICKH